MLLLRVLGRGKKGHFGGVGVCFLVGREPRGGEGRE